MRWLLVLLVAAFAAAGMLVDRFSSPPVEVLVIRTDQWLFCRDYGVTIQIKALDPVTIREVKVTAKFFPEGTCRDVAAIGILSEIGFGSLYKV